MDESWVQWMKFGMITYVVINEMFPGMIIGLVYGRRLRAKSSKG